MKKIRKTLIICFCITAVFIIAITVISKIKKNKDTLEQPTTDNVGETLEQLFLEGDLEALTGKVRVEGLYDNKYGKYYEIADAYYYYNLATEYIEQLNSASVISAQEKKIYIEYGLNYGCIAFNMTKSYFDNGIGEENEAVLLDIRKNIEKTLVNGLKLTKEELEICAGSKDAETVGKIAINVYARFS